MSKTKYKKRLNTYSALTILDSGVSATGIMASNTRNLPSDAFTIKDSFEPSSVANAGSGFSSLSNFAKRVQKELSKPTKTIPSR